MNSGSPISPRILLVEDGLVVAEDIRECLLDWGYDVIGPAARLDQALALAHSEAIDAAVLDVNLAGQRVFPVAGVLRQRGVPFVFTSAYTDDFFPPEFQDVPMLHKPFDSRMLRPLLAEQVRRA